MTEYRLQDALPIFAAELERLLRDDEEAGSLGLANAVAQLKVVDRCRCGDSFCATIKTDADPGSPFPRGSRTISLDPPEGMVNVDISPEGEIMQIEILDRPDVRVILDRLYPMSER